MWQIFTVTLTVSLKIFYDILFSYTEFALCKKVYFHYYAKKSMIILSFENCRHWCVFQIVPDGSIDSALSHKRK